MSAGRGPAECSTGLSVGKVRSWVIGRHLKQKKARRLAGGQSMIDWLFDQSRHRAASVAPRHQKRTVEVAAMAVRCIIAALLSHRIAVGQAAASVDDGKLSRHLAPPLPSGRV